MKTVFGRNGLVSLIAAMALLALPAAAAEYKAEDYAALLKALPNAKHNLPEVIREVSKGGEVATEAKFEMKGSDLLVGAYTSEKGLTTDAEHNVFKEYNGKSTEAAWKPELEVFKDFQHIARSAQYHTLLSMTKVTLLDVVNKAATDRPGTVFEIKAIVENGTPIFSVLVAHDNTMSRLTYDLISGARKG